MKPTERINEIYDREINKLSSTTETIRIITLVSAIEIYLDEEYEKNN